MKGDNPKKGLGCHLTVEECRKITGWDNRSDEEIEEFLISLRRFLGRYLDQYYPID